MRDVFIIGEVAQAHDGSLGMALAYIDALSECGVHAVKFQTHIADAESSPAEPFRVKFSKQDKTRFDYWKRMEFSEEQWRELKERCDQKGVEFMSSPFSNAAVDLLERIGVQRYKIGSGEVTNMLLLQRIAETAKPVILSSGMSSWEELDSAFNFFKSKSIDVSVLQCSTAYPTKPEQYGLNVISEIKERYNCKVGFSDHSAQPETMIAAVAMGAEILEFHAVFDKDSFGPDAKASLTMDEISFVTKAVKRISTAMDSPVDKNDLTEYEGLKQIFEKSLAVNKDLAAGHAITFEDLEAKKPANCGIPARDYLKIIGSKINRDMSQWEFLNQSDLSE